ncbi:MAG: redoxin domain-containing protein [Chloroflexi bacterium]|nr:redoxin domain-containing protein [Chloroflexota bacterium]
MVVTENNQGYTMSHKGNLTAPDFNALVYKDGAFTSVKLSDYVQRGWTLLCFYPGDFTYV